MNRPSRMSDEVVFRVTELFLSTDARLLAVDIADKVNRELEPEPALTREWVYRLLAIARERQFLRLVAPLSTRLREELCRRFQLSPEHCYVVDCPVPENNDFVARAAAELAVELVREVARGGEETVTLGLGPGRATRDFSEHFAALTETDPAYPKLGLVAISAGAAALQPEYSSVSFFNLFPRHKVGKRVGLFAETLVPSKDFDQIKKRPGVKEAFAAKDQIRVLVTSLGDIDDEHDLFSTFYEACGERDWLKSVGCVGNVQYRGYSAEAPILEDRPGRLRAVTLFEIPELVTLANQKGRHVILIARACGSCGRSRARCLRPLLTQPGLRIFSELVVDSLTAYELLEGAQAGEGA